MGGGVDSPMRQNAWKPIPWSKMVRTSLISNIRIGIAGLCEVNSARTPSRSHKKLLYSCINSIHSLPWVDYAVFFRTFFPAKFDIIG